MNTTAMRRCGTRILLLGALAAGCGEITSAEAPDAGSPGTGGRVLAQLDASGAGGATVAGTGGLAVPGTGGAAVVAGTGGGHGTGGAASPGIGGMPTVGGAGGTMEVCLPNQPCAQVPLCPATGAVPHEQRCAASTLCGIRAAICNYGNYPPAYDLSVLPCWGSSLCVSSCESCHQ